MGAVTNFGFTAKFFLWNNCLDLSAVAFVGVKSGWYHNIGTATAGWSVLIYSHLFLITGFISQLLWTIDVRRKLVLFHDMALTKTNWLIGVILIDWCLKESWGGLLRIMIKLASELAIFLYGSPLFSGDLPIILTPTIHYFISSYSQICIK